MLQLAGVDGVEVECPDASSLSPFGKVYLALSSETGLQALGPKPELRKELAGLSK